MKHSVFRIAVILLSLLVMALISVTELADLPILPAVNPPSEDGDGDQADPVVVDEGEWAARGGAGPNESTKITAHRREYWVSPPPAGSDDNPGTIDLPWATLEHAARNVPDDGVTVWFGDGLYIGGHRLSRRFETPTTFKAIHPYQAVLENNGAVVSISGATNITLEGFVFRHSGPGANPLVVAVDRSREGWAEMITLRDNIFHDSFNNDILKIHNGARFVIVEGNIFYNQGESEEHMDVNSVTDVVIQDNIFFNDPDGSDRAPYDTKQYIVIKDSNNDTDGLLGSERIAVRRNIFLNWQGRSTETFVQVGLDGKPYFEAKGVRIENNLMMGNSANEIGAAFGVRGARDVIFANNTVVGDLPSTRAYGFRVTVSGLNPQNKNVYVFNNVWSDPTGTMGSGTSKNSQRFSDGDRADTSNLVLDNNLYWNGGRAIPPGKLVSPFLDDSRRLEADPLLGADQESLILPRWNGSTFLSGNKSIREEFLRLVEAYGRIPPDSPAAGRADPAFAPADDILGRARDAAPDLGAYEALP